MPTARESPKYMFLVLVFLLLPVTAACSDTWTMEQVAPIGPVDWAHGCSMALDGAWTPHIAYFDKENNDLCYARRTASGWDTATVASDGVVGQELALALDGADRPRICYRDTTNAWSGSSWVSETVANLTWWWGTSMAIDSSGYSHIACSDYYHLYYSWEDALGWHTKSIYTAGYLDHVAHPSLVLDAAGRPRLSFNTADRLYYGRLDSDGWTFQGLPYSSGGYSCLALKADGTPGISYLGHNPSTSYDLMFAEWDGASWDVTTVDYAYCGWNSSLAYDSVGHPHIAYSEPGNHWNLRYAVRDAGNWAVQVADYQHYKASAVSLALDPEDTAHIAFTNGSTLLYTKNGPGVAPDAAATDSPELASFGLLLLSAPLIGALRRRRRRT